METLEKNLKDILAETDKEVLITRTGSTSKLNTKNKSGQSARNTETELTNQADAKSEEKTIEMNLKRYLQAQ